MARRSFVNGLALDATHCSGSAGTAIADNATAARHAAWQLGSGNTVKPTAAIKAALAEFKDNRDAIAAAQVPAGMEQIVQHALAEALTDKLLEIFGGS